MKRAITIGRNTHARDGRASIRGVYTKFLGRPNDPHVTAIFEARDGLLTPHFSADAAGGKRQRHYFTPIREDQFISTMTDFGDGMMLRFADALEAVDLDALEREGWTVHIADGNKIARWLRLAARRRPYGEFRVDERTIGAFVLHVLRRRGLPTELKQFPADRPGALLLVRLADERLEVRNLFHFPNGCGGRLPGGEIVQARPPGWYVLDASPVDEAEFARYLPVDRVRQVGDELVDCLSRHPRSDGKGGDISALPLGFSSILGFFAADLLTLMVALRFDAIDQRRRRKASARNRRPHDDAPGR